MGSQTQHCFQLVLLTQEFDGKQTQNGQDERHLAALYVTAIYSEYKKSTR